MRKSKILIIAAPSLLLATAAFAVGTQAPTALTGAGGPKTSYNGYTDQELAAARDQADKAYAGKDITTVHQNLREVINCLAGPQGAGFDASTNDPCRRMGRGALNDVTANSDEHRLLTQAFNEAKNGLAEQDVSAARSQAKKALNDIEDAQTATQQ
jgi:hypothetical protein